MQTYVIPWPCAEEKCILVTAVCVSVCLSLAAFPHYGTDPDVSWGMLGGATSSCALLGGFAIGARVSLLWQQIAERGMSASARTRSLYAWFDLLRIRCTTSFTTKSTTNRSDVVWISMLWTCCAAANHRTDPSNEPINRMHDVKYLRTNVQQIEQLSCSKSATFHKTLQLVVVQQILTNQTKWSLTFMHCK